MTLFYLCIGAGLFLLGLHSFLLQRQLVRVIIAINIMSSGVFMIMVALARRSDITDPILHALVVTGLVVAVSASAFALRLASSLLERTKKPGGDP